MSMESGSYLSKRKSKIQITVYRIWMHIWWQIWVQNLKEYEAAFYLLDVLTLFKFFLICEFIILWKWDHVMFFNYKMCQGKKQLTAGLHQCATLGSWDFLLLYCHKFYKLVDLTTDSPHILILTFFLNALLYSLCSSWYFSPYLVIPPTPGLFLLFLYIYLSGMYYTFPFSYLSFVYVFVNSQTILVLVLIELCWI